MPVYEYQCRACGKQVEYLQKHNDPPPSCEQCKETMKKKVSVSSFSLQGIGWARDNYGLKGKAKS